MYVTEYALCPELIPVDTPANRALRAYILSRAPGPSRKTAVLMLDHTAKRLGYGGMCRCEWPAITLEQWALWTDQRLDEIEPETVNVFIGIFRGLARTAIKNRIGKAEEWLLMRELDFIECDTEGPGVGRALTHDELCKMIDACGDGQKGARDRFAVRLLWATALRASALLALNVSNIAMQMVDKVDDQGQPVKDEHGKIVKVEQWFVTSERGQRGSRTKRTAHKKVRGKGRSAHTVPLDSTAMAAYREYMAVRGEWEGPLIVGTKGNGTITTLSNKRFGAAGLIKMIKTLGEAAGIGHVTPHSFRRTAITEFIDIGGLRGAQLLADHASPTMTAKYDRAAARRMVAAVNKRPLPDMDLAHAAG